MSTYFKFLSKEILEKQVDRNHFPFSQNLFWDTLTSNIDIDKHKNYIIERVLSRGLLADFYILLKLYTTDEIITAIKKSKSLDKKKLNFCSIYFEIPLNELNASPYYD